ncbi:unnamed protein product, partial [Ectocarpus sp. 12 AP-2014]
MQRTGRKRTTLSLQTKKALAQLSRGNYGGGGASAITTWSILICVYVQSGIIRYRREMMGPQSNVPPHTHTNAACHHFECSRSHVRCEKSAMPRAKPKRFN